LKTLKKPTKKGKKRDQKDLKDLKDKNDYAYNRPISCGNGAKTPERGFSIVAQGSHCPERAIVNPGKSINNICTPERGTSISSDEVPLSGVHCSFQAYPGLKCPCRAL